MGCKLTKDETIAESLDNTDMSRKNNNGEGGGGVIPSASEIKSKVDKKMCLAKETPEPVFDLSECFLKECPSGVFVLCKVFRKEVLYIFRNQLTSLRSGGQLADLSLLRVLDLRENRLRTLPEDIAELTQLRELFLSHNLLEHLPKSLHRLHNLEILDVAYNRLNSVAEIKQLANLRVLMLNANVQLHTLPPSLATCESLHDLVVDPDNIEQPPACVCEQGTKAILNYLMGALPENDNSNVVQELTAATTLFLENEKQNKFDRLVADHLEATKTRVQQKTQQLLSSERMALDRDYWLEADARNQQDTRRENLLKEIKVQQDLQETQINALHTQKNQNRDNLIRDIIEEEHRWKVLFEQTLEVKSFAVDPVLLEMEAEEQARLLDQLKVQQADLRKQEILMAMQGLLESELQHVESYQRQKATASSKVLTLETEKLSLLTDVLEDYQQNRNKMVEQIISDESVQKTVVATLITKKDARTWALHEQMRIIESHLAAISTFEMEKRKEGSDQQLLDLAERRVMLSQVLMELLAQQDLRKRELVEMLTKMEAAREGERQDFWLLQYQRLLDSQPENFNFDTIDSELGLNFLTNGVVHCLPFLSRLWQDKSRTLQEITDDDLKEAGIRKESDRCGILKSISQFLQHRMEKVGQLAVKEATDEKGNEQKEVEEKPTRDVDQEEQLAECVICMDKRVKIIFLLCGHLACCDDCHDSVEICPMCRAPIQQRIRVIQA